MVRHKNRYLVVQINEEGKESEPLNLKAPSIHLAVFEIVQQLYGDFGAAAIRSGFTSKYCNPRTKIAVIRARRGPHKLVASSLPFIKTIEGKTVRVMTLYTGATIRNCFKFVQQYQQKKFDMFCVDLKTDEEKLALKNELNAEVLLTIK